MFLHICRKLISSFEHVQYSTKHYFLFGPTAKCRHRKAVDYKIKKQLMQTCPKWSDDSTKILYDLFVSIALFSTLKKKKIGCKIRVTKPL